MQAFDWTWLPSSVKIRPMRQVHDPVYGKQLHQYADPFWMVELTLPPHKEETRREIETLLEASEGIGVFNVYDPRVPIPAHHTSEGAVPALTIKDAERSGSRLLVNGVDGDVITKGDPIAFTYQNKRHYYKAAETLTLSGIDQWLDVYIRPRVDFDSQNIVAERIRPTNRFVVNINDTGGVTTSDDVTVFNLKGVEYWGEI